MKTRPAGSAAKGTKKSPTKWKLRLYVADNTAKCVTAFRNLHQLCAAHIAGGYDIEVIDLVKNPQLARGDQILAVPTVVRKLPAPMRRIIGNLADTERVLVGLDLRPQETDPYARPEDQ